MVAAAAPHDLPAEPYPGLRPYGEEDEHRFFGRERTAYELAGMWKANRPTVLYGPSGVGKTSLLRAGVLPRLDHRRVGVMPIGRLSHGSTFPLAALPERNPFTLASGGDQGPTCYFAARTLDIIKSRERAREVARAAVRPPLTPYQREMLA